ncbi:MAG: hypothetical protein AB8C13_02630 [Phycisphaerales bacterium]
MKKYQNLAYVRRFGDQGLAKGYPDFFVKRSKEYLGACSESRCGYTRQAAVKKLGDKAQPGSVQYVLPRLGDWVPQVRDEAGAALTKLIDAGHCSEFIEHYDLVLSLRRIRRVDLSDQIEKIETAIYSPHAIKMLWTCLDSDNVSTRQFAYSILAKGKMDQGHLVDRALEDPDPAIRFWLVHAHQRDELRLSWEVQKKLLYDRAAKVSVAMLRSLTDEQIVLVKEDLIHLITSASRSMRREACFYLVKKLRFNALEHARNQVAVAVTPGVIEILGELGTHSDCQAVTRFVQSDFPTLRRSAIHALGLLSDDSEYLDDFIQGMQDTNKKVRFAAFEALTARPRSSWYMPVFEAFLKNQTVSGYSAGHLIVAQSGWDPIPVALVLLQPGQSASATQNGVQVLAQWVQKNGVLGWIQPLPDTVELIQKYWSTTRKNIKVLGQDRFALVDAFDSIDQIVKRHQV